MSESLKPQWQPRPLLRQMGAWAVALATAIGVIGFSVDFSLVLLKTGLRAAIATGLTSAALGLFVSLVAAPVAAILAAVCRSIAQVRWRRLQKLWVVPVGVGAFVFGIGWLGPRIRSDLWATLGVAAAFTAGVVISAIVARAPRNRLFGAFEAAVAVISLVLDIAVVPVADRDIHELLSVLTVCGTLAIFAPFRRRLVRVRPMKLLQIFGVLSALALAHVLVVDQVAPGWRIRAWQYGRYEPRVSRALHALVDLDMDGSSPVAWGGDCDDLDPRRYPRARERPGVIDANCNGVVPPDTPSDRDRGLAPPKGDPDMPAGSIDRVILLTIDCLRDMSFTPEITPKLLKVAERGVRFTRLYAGGTATYISTPLMQRATDDGPTMAGILNENGIGSTAVTGVLAGHSGQKGMVLTGFTRIDNPQGLRMRAAQTTDTLLRYVTETKNKKQYLWAHYFDAHRGRVQPPEITPEPLPPGGDAEYALYRDNVKYIDGEVARVIDTLAENGMLERSVILITADHGEAFGDHGLTDHAVDTYESLVHVPGILIAPGLLPGYYDKVVSHRDLPATLLGAFGLVASHPEVERFGRSWLRLRGAPMAPLHEFVVSRSARASRAGEPQTPMASIVEKHYKLSETFDENLIEMYDLESDPDELRDLTPNALVETAILRRDLALYRDIDHYP
jgi:arylsulfatase A-like enzyme